MNKLTIIVTYYNAEEYITGCLESIKQQRTQDFNLIIVNDGSTDQSKKLMDEAIKDYDKNIRFIDLDENSGHAHARNIALEEVETPYFMFLDADDQYLPSRIDAMIQTYENHEETDIVIGQIGRDVHGEWKVFPTHEEIKRDEVVTLERNPEILQSIGPGGKLFSAKFVSLRFDEDVVFSIQGEEKK